MSAGLAADAALGWVEVEAFVEVFIMNSLVGARHHADAFTCIDEPIVKWMQEIFALGFVNSIILEVLTFHKARSLPPLYSQLTQRNKGAPMTDRSTIQIFDPAMCCSTGVCGPEVDQELVRIAADVDWARCQGGLVERINLAQQPLRFAANATVKALLERSGEDALPLTLVDGEVALAGRYPSRAQLARWCELAAAEPESAISCCGGRQCN